MPRTDIITVDHPTGSSLQCTGSSARRLLNIAYPYKELHNDGSSKRAGHVKWRAVTMEMVDVIRGGVGEEGQATHHTIVLYHVH